jgi:GMP synthase (glutamine-hydrolysing)
MAGTADTVLYLHHSEGVGPGWLGEAIDQAGIPTELIRLDEGEPLPDSTNWRAVVVLGGAMGAYEVVDHPYLLGEKEFISGLVAEDVPVLGICLGSQLIADALGGRAYRAPNPEGGLLALEMTEAGREDPVVANLPDRVLVSHGDTFDLPPGAELLAFTDEYQHIYRCGSALAIQSHPEAGADLAVLATSRPGGGNIVAAGVDKEELIEDLRAAENVLREQAIRFFAAWVATI